MLPEIQTGSATLYGRTLEVVATWDGGEVRATWQEPVFDETDDRARYEIQQRYWRSGRGEATEADHRAEMQSDLLRRYDERMERGE
jgi:hypothetical protein